MAEAGKEKEKKKVKTPTAIKRDLQNEKRRLNNRIFTSQVRTAVRHFDESLEKGNAAQVKENLSQVFSLMDKGVKKGVFKSNRADRTKSRMTQRAAKV
jgi:small subunit ribosomal protein S20